MNDEEFFTFAAWMGVMRANLAAERERLMQRHGWELVQCGARRRWKDPKTGKLYGIWSDAYQIFSNRFLRSVRMGLACLGCTLAQVGVQGPHREGCKVSSDPATTATPP